tara:strand:- start:353 stop:778 length:426 start_codon:yes stop_codon:yes gene_type:complete
MAKFDSHKWMREHREGKFTTEASVDRTGQPIKGFTPGDMYRNDFDYVGMLRFSAEMEIPEDLSQLSDPSFIQILKDLYESYTDVNYHTEGADLGNALDWIEDAVTRDDPQKKRMELDRSLDFLESHKEAAMKTLTDITKGK